MRHRYSIRGNTFAYLLALIVLLTSLAIALVGGISYRVSARALVAETRQAVLLREAQLRSRMEAEIRAYQALSQGLSLNGSILGQLTAPESFQPSDILRFREILQALSSQSMSLPSGSLVSVYFRRSGSVATQTTRYLAADFFMRYAEADREAILSRINRPQAFSMLVDVAWDIYGTLPAQRVLLLGKGLPYSSPYPLGGALIEIPIAHLEAMLAPDAGCVQFVAGEADELLLSASKSETPGLLEEALSLIDEMDLKPGAPFWLDATLAGKPHFVTVSVSAPDNWKYVTVIPAETIFEGIRNISHITLLVGVAAALLVVLVSALALHRLYTPIRDLLGVLALRGAPYRPGQSAKHDLAHIHSLVNTAWRENESMQRLVGGMRDLMRQDVLGRLLDNNTVEDHALLETGLDTLCGHFRVALPEINPADGAVSRYALCARAAESLGEQRPAGLQVLCVVRPYDQAALLLYSEAPLSDEAVRPALEALIARLNADAQGPCTLAVSHALHGVRSLGDGQVQAQETLYWALSLGKSGVVTHLQMLKSGQIDMFALLSREDVPRQDALRSLYAHAVNHGDYLVAYLLDRLGESGGEADAALRGMMRLKSPGERLDYVMRLPELKSDGTRRLSAAQLTQYLKEHHNDVNLSLSTMADHFGYTSNYLSALIKEETGMGFLECLTRIRLEHATHLLTNTDALVSDVAAQTGFGHVNTFIRTFRRYCHETPAQYRAKRRKDG